MAKKNRTVKVDFSEVDKGGGGRIRIPEGDYKAKVKGVVQKESQAGNTMLVWDFVITEGKHKGKSLRAHTVLTKNAAWKLRDLLEAMGVDVPAKMVNLNLDKYEEQELGISVIDGEPYEGKIRSEIDDFVSLDVLSGDDVEEDDEDEDEEEEDSDDEESDDEDEEDLEEVDVDDL